MAQLEEHLLCVHEELGFESRYTEWLMSIRWMGMETKWGTPKN